MQLILLVCTEDEADKVYAWQNYSQFLQVTDDWCERDFEIIDWDKENSFAVSHMVMQAMKDSTMQNSWVKKRLPK